MFVLPPPPPRYPGTAGGAWGSGMPGSVPIIETNNSISHPSGTEYQFSVGEGIIQAAPKVKNIADI